MWSTWGASPGEGKSGAELGIVNRKVARRANIPPMVLFCMCSDRPKNMGHPVFAVARPLFLSYERPQCSCRVSGRVRLRTGVAVLAPVSAQFSLTSPIASRHSSMLLGTVLVGHWRWLLSGVRPSGVYAVEPPPSPNLLRSSQARDKKRRNIESACKITRIWVEG